MNEFAAKFVEDFHNLPGLSEDDRRKNLGLLLNRHRDFKNSTEFSNDLVKILSPKTFLEELFHIDILIYFKRFDELWRKFLNGHDITIAKISRQQWFINEFSNKYAPDELITDVFPTISYTVRLKILNRIRPKNEDIAGQLYDLILERYGLSQAVLILDHCEANKIRTVLMSHRDRIKLSSSQLRNIFDKDPDCIDYYVDGLAGSEFWETNKLFKYIANNNLQKFIDLRSKKKSIRTRLGRRLTKKALRGNHEMIVGKYRKNLDACLDDGMVVRELKDDFEPILIQMFPKRIIGVYDIRLVLNILKVYPRKRRFQLFRRLYEQVYCEEFGKNLEFINNEILDFITDVELREALAKIKAEEDQNDLFLEFFNPKSCLEIILNKLKLTTKLNDRLGYLRLVTNSCIRYQDMDTLLKVGHLAWQRFKNDNWTLFHTFLTKLRNDAIVKKFTQQHWDCVNDILAKLLVSETHHYGDTEVYFLANYLEFLLEQNDPTKFCQLLDKSAVAVNNFVIASHSHIKIKPESLRAIFNFLLMEDLNSLKTQDDPKLVLDFYSKLLNNCNRFNKMHPTYKFDFWNALNTTKWLRRIFENADKHYNKLNFIHTLVLEKEFEQFQGLYFEKVFPKSRNLYRGLLKFNVEVITKYFDSILKVFFDLRVTSSDSFTQFTKRYSHLGFDERLKTFLLGKFASNEHSDQLRSVKFLPQLLKEDEFLDLSKGFIPSQSKVDLTNDDVKKLYEIQCEIVSNFRFYSPICLPTVLKFCKGDFLKNALHPVYSFVYKSPENRLVDILDWFIDQKAVSVQKHGLQLSLIVGNSSLIQRNFKKLSSPLLPVLQYYKNNPSEELWALIEPQLWKIDKDDDVILDFLVRNLAKNEKHFSTFIWNFIEKHNKIHLRNLFLEIVSLDRDLFVDILDRHCFELQCANAAVIKYLVESEDFGNFALLLKKIQRLKQEKWILLKTSSRKDVLNFVRQLCSAILCKKRNKPAVELLSIFNQVFTPIESFDKFVLVNLTAIFATETKNSQELALSLLCFIRDVMELYGDGVWSGFLPTLSNALASDITIENVYELCQNLLKSSRNLNEIILVIKILPNTMAESDKDRRIQKEIITDLRNRKKDLIQLHLNLWDGDFQ